jgi:hypothetical protein
MNRFLTFLVLAFAFVFALASIASANCTQGFWKNHEDQWCAEELTLGNVLYTKAELLAIFDQPVEGDGLVALAHQLIAARLNECWEADPSPDAGAADALIGDLVVPPIGAGYLDPGDTSDLVQALDEYNNLPGDAGGFGGCQPISVEEFSWGRIKAEYR